MLEVLPIQEKTQQELLCKLCGNAFAIERLMRGCTRCKADAGRIGLYALAVRGHGTLTDNDAAFGHEEIKFIVDRDVLTKRTFDGGQNAVFGLLHGEGAAFVQGDSTRTKAIRIFALGIVIADGGFPFTQTPLTTDQSSLQTLLGRLRSGVVEDGTAIGNGLATAVNRLRESDSKSKVIILLTDGVNNRGQIAPLTVADIAKEQGIKVYTIGVGRNGTAPYPVFDQRGREAYTVDVKVEIDEKMLREIADKTGGEYFRATDKRSLESIYKQIDSMEKSKVEIFEITHTNEEYLIFVLWAIALLIGEFIVKHIILKRIP